MARDTPSVQDGRLTLPDGRQLASIPVGSAAWWAWLADAGTTSFSFGAGAERFTARRERKAGGQYWYAYRRQAGRLRKAYLGKAEDLTLERLHAAAAALAGSTLASAGDQVPAPQAGAHGSPRSSLDYS